VELDKQVNPHNPISNRVRAHVAIALTIALLFVYFYRRGKDVNFDQLNSHAGLAFDALNGHVTRRIPYGAGYGTLLPAFWALPWWILSSRLPDRVSGLILFIPVVPIIFAGRSVGRSLLRNKAASLQTDVLILSVTATSVSLLTEVGTTFGNLPSGLFVLLGIAVLCSRISNKQLVDAKFAAVSGSLFGIGAGLKWTNAIYLLSAGLALLVVYPRLKTLFAFGLSSLVGTFSIGAPWFLASWSDFGSPMFPWYNDIFKSGLFSEQAPSDPRWLLRVSELPFFPLELAQGTAKTGEIASSDARLLLVFSAFILLAIQRLISRSKFLTTGWQTKSPFAFLTIFFCSSYIVWGLGFGVQRYFIVGEVVAGILLLKCCDVLLRAWSSNSKHYQLFLIPLLLLFTTTVPNYGHIPWSGGTWYDFKVNNLRLSTVDTVIFENSRITYFSTLFAPSANRIGLGVIANPGFRLEGRINQAMAQAKLPIVIFLGTKADIDSSLSKIGFTTTQECGTLVSDLEVANWCRIGQNATGN
jgi:hypothetical protein